MKGRAYEFFCANIFFLEECPSMGPDESLTVLFSLVGETFNLQLLFFFLLKSPGFGQS